MRRSGTDGIVQLTSVDHSVTFNPADGEGEVVDLSAAGGVTSIVAGDPGITVHTVAGVSTIGQQVGAEWALGVTRVYAIDSTRPDDSGAGFATPASNSAADYRTASVAAGTVAKKTVAGLSAIFPKVGAGRFVEIQINAVGTYSAPDLAALLNGVSGYASIVVRGTGTVASAGVTKFDGTQEETSSVGGVTATGLNAPGYNPTSSFTSGQHLVLQKVGGGSPAFTVSGLPLGVRGRFDVATTTALLQNAARQIGRVNSVDNIFFQTQMPTDAVNTDVLYLEMPGVALTGDFTLNAPGTDGIILVGLDVSGIITVSAGRHRFVFCKGDSASAHSFSSPTGVVFAQDYTHPVYGSVTVGGGLRVTGSATVSNGPVSMNGLVSVLNTTLSRVTGAPLWGAGCACNDLTINSTWAGATDDATTNPDIGVSDSTNVESQPYIFGAGSQASFWLDGSSVRIGRMRLENGNSGLPFFLPSGKCNIEFVGSSNVTSDASALIGMDLKLATKTEIRVGSAPPALTGVQGDMYLCTGTPRVIDTWGHAVSQEIYDLADNHIIYAIATGEYQHAVSPSVFYSQFDNSAGNISLYGIVRMSPASSFCTAAATGNVSDASGIAGLAEQANSGPVFGTSAITVRPLAGVSLALFDANNPAVGKTVYLSDTAGVVTVTPPASGKIVPLGVVVLNFPGTARAVVQWDAAGAGNNAQATWPAANARVYAVDFVNGNDANVGYADMTTTGAAAYAVACAAAGLAAKKTIAGLASIFPRIGNGRTVEVVIANGGVNTVQAYAGQLGDFLSGCYGYFQVNVRATGTNTTAGAVAFDGSAADCIYQGGITFAGGNVAGYNPVGASTTSLPCQLAGGGAAALPAEPAIPLGLRVRFDAATTTAALRNQCRQIAAVSGGNTITPQTAFTAVPANGDVFYIEDMGITVGATNVSLGLTGDNAFSSDVVASAITGINFSAGLTLSSTGTELAFCRTTSPTVTGVNSLNVGQLYIHVVRGALTVGGGLRCDGAPFFNGVGGGQFLLSGVVSTGTTSLFGPGIVQWRDGSYVSGHITVGRNNNGAGVDLSDTLPSVGALSAQSRPRIVGRLSIITSNTSIGLLDITGAGGSPAIQIEGTSTVSFANGLVSGSTGNNDVGLDLTLSFGSTIIIGTTLPTVTGLAGDVRLGDGTIMSWSQVLNGMIDVNGNRFINRLNGIPVATIKFSGTLLGGAGAVFTYLADAGPGLAANNTNPLGYFFPQKMMFRLFVNVITNTLANSSTVTLYKNGVATSLQVTIGAGATGQFRDNAHTVFLSDNDQFDLRVDDAGADATHSMNLSATVQYPS